MKQTVQDTNSDKGAEDGQYARTDEELYEKAIRLLDQCKIEIRA